MKTPVFLAAAGLLLSTAAFADAPTQPGNASAMHANLREQVKANLQQAGFSNVTVVPDSFLVTAKDQSGNPVTMFVNPNSVTEVVAEGPSGQANGNQTEGNQSGNMQQTANNFTTVPTTARLTSEIVGLDVHNNKNQDIGTIKDVAYGQSGAVKAYIIGLGGFLGMDNHYIAVSPKAVNISYDHADNKWQATMNATADQLKSAPQFKFPSAS
jgi:hypothetical protein